METLLVVLPKAKNIKGTFSREKFVKEALVDALRLKYGLLICFKKFGVSLYKI
jgi:hypothetical protein